MPDLDVSTGLSGSRILPSFQGAWKRRVRSRWSKDLCPLPLDSSLVPHANGGTPWLRSLPLLMASLVTPAICPHVSLNGFLPLLTRYDKQLLADAASVGHLVLILGLRIPPL